MAADLAHQLPFVAGGFGHAYVYDTRTGASVAAYQLADPGRCGPTSRAWSWLGGHPTPPRGIGWPRRW